jgi:hypothetical protein
MACWRRVERQYVLLIEEGDDFVRYHQHFLYYRADYILSTRKTNLSKDKHQKMVLDHN